MIEYLVRHLRTDEGQGLAEYALILALIAMFCVAAGVFFGAEVAGMLSVIGSNIESVM